MSKVAIVTSNAQHWGTAFVQKACKRLNVRGLFSGAHQRVLPQNDILGALASACKVSHQRIETVNSKAFLKQLEDLHVSVVLNVGYGQIYQSIVLNSGLKVINLHPSALPEHRGANPIASVIMAGETISGVTAHLMTERIDEGPYLCQQKFELDDRDDFQSLQNKLSSVACLLLEPLAVMIDKSQYSTFKVPKVREGSYVKRPEETAFLIDLQKDDLQMIDRTVRAYGRRKRLSLKGFKGAIAESYGLRRIERSAAQRQVRFEQPGLCLVDEGLKQLVLKLEGAA